jgi:hypothetical protein
MVPEHMSGKMIHKVVGACGGTDNYLNFCSDEIVASRCYVHDVCLMNSKRLVKRRQAHRERTSTNFRTSRIRSVDRLRPRSHGGRLKFGTTLPVDMWYSE